MEEAPPSTESDPSSGAAGTAERPLGRSVAIGVAVAVGLGATFFFLIAIPFYTLASFEPNGLGRPIVRTGLFRIALPIGALLGVVCGAVAGSWYRRGGGWGGDDHRDRFGTR